MKALLYLVHRIPYPPNKGDKIRSYHLLRYLSRNYRVYLGTFIDNEEDWKYLDDVRSLCSEVFIRPLNPTIAKIKSITGLIKGIALTLPYYNDSKLQTWVDKIVDSENVTDCVVFSSSMAQYVSGDKYQTMRRIIDFVDIDSDKWLQYSRSKSWPMNWLWRREGNCLMKYEKSVANNFAASFFVSKNEATMFQNLAPQIAHKVKYFNNGVDTSYFSSDLIHPNPYDSGQRIIVFTGAMDYWANVDAVTWFAQEVFPYIQKKIDNVLFYIVGSNPSVSVTRLTRNSGVIVTGFVEDIRPYLANADIAVAPLRIARGVQNKVLEAMAMAKPIVVTPAAMEGIDLCPNYNPAISNNALEFANFCMNFLVASSQDNTWEIGRDCILSKYSWDSTFKPIGDLLS
jgi:sugar transferase (PEP-CTERM/EpsH1 system associated)